jgi:hypothetical protein
MCFDNHSALFDPFPFSAGVWTRPAIESIPLAANLRKIVLILKRATNSKL